ncbi:acyltransferase [Polynucleobacter sp. 15G-AUS-farblos]|nr:acyltransferase [Polynucleobacter sp. 15G-AUS-farblos]
MRAVAVLMVVAFHAFPAWFPGGFIGVDVFFVISGYLISSILFKNFEAGTFSLADFYIRRIRRIFPALIVVLVASLIGGWFFFLSDEYAQLGKHVAAGAGFVSNLVLWHDSSYFDNESASKPLLHLWSLGIEEQFYIVWPIVLMVLYRLVGNSKSTDVSDQNSAKSLSSNLSRDLGKKLWMVIGILTVLSFALNVILILSNQVAAFYSPLTRFWELLIGALLANLALHQANRLERWRARWANPISVLAIILLIAGMYVLNRFKLFPGWWALIPVIGAFLLIAVGKDALINRTLLSNRLMVWIGVISYPLYLWHWPLLSFVRIVEGDFPRLKVGAVILSFVLAWLTYRLIESPLRFGARAKVKALGLIAAMCLVGATGFAIYQQDGVEGYGIRTGEANAFAKYFENNPPDWNYFTQADILKKYRHECNFYDFNPITPKCYEPDRSSGHEHDPLLMIWGDSTAQMLSYGLSQVKPANWQILQVATSTCLPDPNANTDSYTDFCRRSNWRTLGAIAQFKPDVVLISQESGQNIQTMQTIAEKLKADGVKKVIFMGPAPHWKTVLPKLILRKLWQDTPERTWTEVDLKYIKTNQELKSQWPKDGATHYVDLIELMCNEQGCLTRVGPDKLVDISAFDYVHFSPAASEYVARNLLEEVVFGNASPSTK